MTQIIYQFHLNKIYNLKKKVKFFDYSLKKQILVNYAKFYHKIFTYCLEHQFSYKQNLIIKLSC